MDASRQLPVALSKQVQRTQGILSVLSMWRDLSVKPVPAREPWEKRGEDDERALA